MGQSRVIYPHFSPCFECLLHLFPADPLNFQECTVAVTPRQPEHCIVFAMWFKWREDPQRKELKIDGDDPDHINWIYERASERAREFGIEGVNYKLTQGVVKKIIPAIASTNAIIAAACANEAYKIATNSAPCIDNWMMYNGADGVFTSTMAYEMEPECLVCSQTGATIKVDPTMTLQQFIDYLINDNDKFANITNPSLSRFSQLDGTTTLLYMTGFLAVTTAENIPKRLDQLLAEGDTIVVINRAEGGQSQRNYILKVLWRVSQ